MKNFLFGFLIIFLVFGIELNAQFMTSGNNLFSTAKFVAPGKDTSSYVLGDFTVYEILNAGSPNITAYQFKVGDSIAWADSCGYEHFTNKHYVTKLSQKGTVEWILISGSCDTLSAVEFRGVSTDDNDNLIIVGTYNNEIELDGSAMSSTAEWDMFIYKISPDGTILWQKNNFASGDTSAVIPTDIQVISNEIYISGSYYGTSNFSGSSFQSGKEQFFLLKTGSDGSDLEVTAGLPVKQGSSSILNDIDFLSSNDIAGTLSIKDSLLIVNKLTGFPSDTIYKTGGFRTNVLYVIDSSDITSVSSSVDSFFVADPPNPDNWYYLVEEGTFADWSIVLDTLYVQDGNVPELKNHLSLFRGDTLALSFEIPSLPIDFLVDRNDNDNMYGLYNYETELQFKQDIIPANPFPSAALVCFNFPGGTNWVVSAFSPTDTTQAGSFCIDPESNFYISGNVGNSSGSHVLTVGSVTLPSSQNEDSFVAKVAAGNVVWGQIISDSATDIINDMYALDRFTIVGAGEYAGNIAYDQFEISTAGIRDMFLLTIQPHPEFDLNLSSFRDENSPLCDGDSVLLVITSSHECTFQWLKDSTSIAGEVNDSLWVHESGNYAALAISNLIAYDNLKPYSKTSRSFQFEFGLLPNDTISIADTTVFCSGGNAVLSIALNSSDSCSWYELSGGFLAAASFLSVSRSGAYHARIESESGCVSLSDTIQILTIDPPVDSIAITEGNNLFCAGDSLQLECFDPGVNSYIWYKDGDSLTTESGPVKIFHTEGSYSVKIVNENNCASFSDTLTLVEIKAPILEQWFDDEVTGICEGERSEIRLSNHGQTTYYWFYNNDSIKNFDSPVYLAEEPGSYRATLVKEGVCYVQTDTFLLQVHPNPTASINIDSDSIICDNETTRLYIESPGILQYRWFKNGTEMEGVTNSSIDISESASYYSEFTSEHNCPGQTRSVPIKVKRSPSLTLGSEGGKLAFCKNDSLQLIVENSNIVTYQWQRNGSDIPVTRNKYYSSVPGDYTVLLSDTITNCTAQTNVLKIIELALPDNLLTYAEQDPLCERDTAILVATPGASVYEWSMNGSVQVFAKEQTYKATKNGTYQVKLVNENNCSAVSSIIALDFLDSQIPPINQDVNYISTLSFQMLQWYKDNSPIDQATGQVYSVNESGFYHVEVTHSNGCVASSKEIQICSPFPEIDVDHNILTASAGDSYQWFFGIDTIFGATSAVYIAQLSGYYSVDITLSDLCISRSPEVEVCYPAPEIEIQANNVLKASLGLSYQWYLNNEPISGADARLHVVTLEGNYKVEVEDLDNCISFSDPVFMQASDIGLLPAESIEVYPNPFDEMVYLQLPFDFDFTGYVLEVQNSLGEVVSQQIISANPEKIQLPSLGSGLYVAIIYNNFQRVHIKLVKK